jgi:hypothetical protein
LTGWAEGLSLVVIRKTGEVEEEIGIRETDRQIQPEGWASSQIHNANTDTGASAISWAAAK